MIIPGHPTFDKIKTILFKSIEELSGSIPEDALLDITNFIASSMSGSNRRFHFINHVFDVAGNGTAHQQLAAFFHDVIYTQIDDGIHPFAEKLLNPFVESHESTYKIKSNPNNDKTFLYLLEIFDFKEGSTLNPVAGQNEFLSALVMAKSLEKYLSTHHILRLIACIEATIPFRKSPFDALKERIRKLSKKLDLNLTNDFINQSLQDAMELSNRDVQNFSESNIATFLSNTWQIIPETNHQLRYPEKYSLLEFRSALFKMETFLNQLDTNNVFHSYNDDPPESTLLALNSYAKKNVEVAKMFIGNKISTLAILESLVPDPNESLANIMGIHENDEFAKQAVDFLPKIYIQYPQGTTLNPNIINMFDLDFDIHTSSISRFVYLINGHETMMKLVLEAKKYFESTMKSDQFLDSVNPFIVSALAHALSFVSGESTEKYFISKRDFYFNKIKDPMTQFDYKSFLSK